MRAPDGASLVDLEGLALRVLQLRQPLLETLPGGLLAAGASWILEKATAWALLEFTCKDLNDWNGTEVASGWKGAKELGVSKFAFGLCGKLH